MIIRPALALAAAILATPVAALAGDYRVMGEDERAISFIESAIKTDSDGRKETVFFIAFAEPVGDARRAPRWSVPRSSSTAWRTATRSAR